MYYRGKHNRFLNVNTRSIVNKVTSFEHMLITYSPHVVAITETWLTPSIPDEDITPPDYKMIRVDRLDSRGGGVAVVYKDSLLCRLLPQPFPARNLVVQVSNWPYVINRWSHLSTSMYRQFFLDQYP